MLTLSDKNRYYLTLTDFIDTLKRFFTSQFPDCECEVQGYIPNCHLLFEEDFFATSLVKTLRLYMPSIPTKIAFEFKDGKFIFKIIYPLSSSIGAKSELFKLYALSKCALELFDSDCGPTLIISMPPASEAELRVYNAKPDRLHAAIIKAYSLL